MNSDIIPQGSRELLGAPATIAKNSLVIRATSNATFSSLVFIYPAAPANAAVASSGALSAGSRLEYVKSVTIDTGSVEVVYLP